MDPRRRIPCRSSAYLSAGRPVFLESVRDRQNDVAITRRRIEQTGTVTEPALALTHFDDRPGFPIESTQARQGFRDLLAVRADVLDWRTAGP